MSSAVNNWPQAHSWVNRIFCWFIWAEKGISTLHRCFIYLVCWPRQKQRCSCAWCSPCHVKPGNTQHPSCSVLAVACVLFNSLLVRRAWPQLGVVIPAGVEGRAFRAEVLHFRYCATEKPLSSKLFHPNLFIYLYLYMSMQVYLGADLYSCTCVPTPALRGGCSELPPTGPTRWASDPSPMPCRPTEYHAALKWRLKHDCGGGQES